MSLGVLMAQESLTFNKSERTETEDGVKYYVHTVKKGQTLYSISKVYEVSVEEIIKINPDAKDGLRIDQELWIVFSIESVKVKSKPETDEDFVYHIVKKGETFYSISGIYGISIEKIKDANPELSSGLQEGAYLKIPLSFDDPEKTETKTTAAIDTTPATAPAFAIDTATATATATAAATATATATATDTFSLGTTVSQTDTIDYVVHKVKKGETVFSIAKEYLLNVKDIYALNPGSENGIRKKQKLKIPLIPLGEYETVQKDTSARAFEKVLKEDNILLDKLTFCDSLTYDKEFHIALMIPLYLEEIDSLNVDDEAEIMPPQFYKSFRFLPFYQGLLLAVDSLEKSGFKACLHVYDVTADTVKTLKSLEDTVMKNMDMIIGLMYSGSFNVVSRFAKANGINLVNPISNRREIIKDNKHVFKVMTSPDTQIGELAKYIVDKYHDENILIIYNTTEEQKNNLAKLELGLNNSSQSMDNEFSFKSISCNHCNVKNIKGSLSAEKNNILITLSNDQAFVINYLRQMHTVLDSFNLVIVGSPSWKNFRSLETKYLLDLNLHLYSNSFIDYSDEDVKIYIKNFRLKYETEPNEYAFQGFDIGFYFFNALKKYGEYFDVCIPLFRVNSLQTEYYFNKEGNDGYESSYLNIYKYEDYKLIDARKVSEPVEETIEE